MTAPAYDDAVDTRFVFKAYAVVAWVAGAFLYAWGRGLFVFPLAGMPPYSQYLVPRLSGAVLLGIGFLAWATARTLDDDGRRKALGWWAAGHAVVFVGLALQLLVVIGDPNVWGGGSLAVAFLAATSITFAYLWQTAEGIPWGGLGLSRGLSILEEIRRPEGRPLRPSYEEKIREAAAQEERHRLARDLHDSIKQQIFVMHTAAATAQARFDSDPVGARAAVEQVRTSAREAMTEMEAMLDQLRASPLENNGLVEALKKQCEALRFRTGADVKFTLGDLPPSETLPLGAHQGLLRIAQEALANVGRHARATHVTVTLDSTPLSVQLRVNDDGVGFDTAQEATGMGLGNMRSRVEALGGVLLVTSRHGEGTLVRASIPRVRADRSDVEAYFGRAASWAGLVLWHSSYTLWIAAHGGRLSTIVNGAALLVLIAILARVTATYLRARKAVAEGLRKGDTA